MTRIVLAAPRGPGCSKGGLSALRYALMSAVAPSLRLESPGARRRISRDLTAASSSGRYSNPWLSIFKVSAFAVIVRITSCGNPSGSVALISTVIST